MSVEQGTVFVTLDLAGQLCGVPVSRVRDVLRHQPIAPVPLAPPEVAGNLNLRGRIVTAIDLRRRLRLPAGQQPMALVTENESDLYALLVDQVRVAAEKPPLAVRAAWTGAEPYVIDGAGQKLFLGARLPDGWTVSAITSDAVLLRRGSRLLAVHF